MTRSFTVWGPAIIVMGVIFMLSSQSYEQQSIKKQLTRAVERTVLSPYLSEVKFQYGTLTVDGRKDGPGGVMEFILRKLAHFTEYFLLSLCLLKALRYTTRLSVAYAVLVTILIAAGYAVTDEIHQLFAVNRGSRPQDVILDTAGALAGMLTYMALAGWKKRRHSESRMTEGV